LKVTYVAGYFLKIQLGVNEKQGSIGLFIHERDSKRKIYVMLFDF